MSRDDRRWIEAQAHNVTLDPLSHPFGNDRSERLVKLGAVDADEPHALDALKLKGVAVDHPRDQAAVGQIGGPELPVVGETLEHAAAGSTRCARAITPVGTLLS